MKVKEEHEKAGLKTQHSKSKDHGIWSHHFMANRWGNNVRLYFLGLQKHCSCDCSHEIKRSLFLGRKAMTNLDSILKSRDITLPTKVHLVKAMVFAVIMHGYETWTIKKAECQRIDYFELWFWRRLLRVPWPTRRSNQSILKKSVLNFHWKDWCCSWSFNALATWYDELTHWKRPWSWERLKARGKGDYRGWDGWISSPIRWKWVWASSRSWCWTGKTGGLQSMWSQELDTTGQLNWCKNELVQNLESYIKSVYCFLLI